MYSNDKEFLALNRTAYGVVLVPEQCLTMAVTTVPAAEKQCSTAIAPLTTMQLTEI